VARDTSSEVDTEFDRRARMLGRAPSNLASKHRGLLLSSGILPSRSFVWDFSSLARCRLEADRQITRSMAEGATKLYPVWRVGDAADSPGTAAAETSSWPALQGR
jgi:hypothetical protein